MAKITFTIEVGEKWTPEAVWPDGDAPEKVNAQAVVEAIDDHVTCLSDFIYEYNVDGHVDITVERDGKTTTATWDP